jgi:hypothetical protein
MKNKFDNEFKKKVMFQKKQTAFLLKENDEISDNPHQRIRIISS